MFANPTVTRIFINRLRSAKGLPPLTGQMPSGRQRSEESYDELASVLRRELQL
jgi:hypothetical protein